MPGFFYARFFSTVEQGLQVAPHRNITMQRGIHPGETAQQGIVDGPWDYSVDALQFFYQGIGWGVQFKVASYGVSRYLQQRLCLGSGIARVTKALLVCGSWGIGVRKAP